MPTSGVLTAPQFTTRNPIKFIVPDNTAANIDGTTNPFLQNNPMGFYVQPGSVAAIDLAINGKTFFRGDGEFAPFKIELPWQTIAYSDYQMLASLRPYLVHLISHRNDGYYGKLVMDGFKPKLKGSDVGSTTGTFYVLNPSDQSGAKAVNRITTPTGISVTNVANQGYIQSGQSNYYWVTFTTIYGETDPWASGAIAAGTNSKNVITWTWPAYSSRCETALIYVANANNPSAAKQLAEVINGEPPYWNDLVGYVGAQIPITPPASGNNTAFRGFWQGGLWINEA